MFGKLKELIKTLEEMEKAPAIMPAKVELSIDENGEMISSVCGRPKEIIPAFAKTILNMSNNDITVAKMFINDMDKLVENMAEEIDGK